MVSKMERLTFKDPNGTWGIVGMTQDNMYQKMYAYAMLLTNEEIRLMPEEVVALNTFVGPQKDAQGMHGGLLSELWRRVE